MKKITLELSAFQVLMLEVFLENKVDYMENFCIPCEREKDLLKKIYEASPSTDRKFPNLTK